MKRFEKKDVLAFYAKTVDEALAHEKAVEVFVVEAKKGNVSEIIRYNQFLMVPWIRILVVCMSLAVKPEEVNVREQLLYLVNLWTEIKFCLANGTWSICYRWNCWCGTKMTEEPDRKIDIPAPLEVVSNSPPK